MAGPLKAWSYSRWDLHNTCPLRFKYEVIDGRKAAASPAMEKGHKVHQELTAYIIAPPGELAVVPKSAGHATGLVQELRAFSDVVVEQQWGFDRQWKPTGWFGDETWLRSVLDVAVLYDDMTAEVIDWKTGKPRGTHEDQMELFAVSLMAKFIPAVSVTTRLVYTDFPKQEIGEYPRTDFAKLVAKWETKVAPMFTDTAYLPRPNDGCKFCPFSRTNSNGRDCRYG